MFPKNCISALKVFLFPAVLAFLFVYFSTPSHSYFSKTVSLDSNIISADTLTSYAFSTQLNAGKSVCSLVTSRNFSFLYEHLAGDLQQTITKSEFVDSMKNSTVTSCELTGEVTYKTSKQTEVGTKMFYFDRDPLTFLSIFNWEQNEWRLLGSVLQE